MRHAPFPLLPTVPALPATPVRTAQANRPYTGPRLPLQTMPVIVGDKNNLLSHLKKVEGKPLTFTLSGVYPERYEGMTVEPFFRLYECR